MFAAGLIPTPGFNRSASDFRIQYTHTHENAEHDHDHAHKTDIASTKSDDDSHAKKHSHELVISEVALTFIESKNILAFAFSLSARSYPKIQDAILPLSHCLHSIFRPPISA